MDAQQQPEDFKWTKSRTAKVASAAISLPLLMCGLSGKWLWWQAWYMVLVQLLLYGAASSYIYMHNPGLMTERERFIRNKGTAEFDKVVATISVGITYIMYLAAGLQPRFSRSSIFHPAPAATAAAAILEIAVISLQCWAMCTNRWFSSVVRLQTERGHRVCSHGPYACVRHPGYIAWVLQAVVEAVLLQSSWYFWLGIGRSVMLVVRTVAEDAWLHQNLPGYKAYAAKVKWRWLPYIW